MLERDLISTFSSMDAIDSTQIPSSISTVPGSNGSHADLIASSLLSFPDTSPISVSSSFERILEKAFASVSVDESVQDRLVDRTLKLTSLLLESTKRCFRKRASAHNSNTWLLPPELTVKVYSMLDTKSLMQAAACCTMFNKCAMNRLCYSHIDLTTSAKLVDDEVVSTMIHRAGNELRSLRVGRDVRPAVCIPFQTVLTEYCLRSLTCNNGFLGSHLRSLRLYNLKSTNYKYAMRDALSACSNITDLRIVGMSHTSEELFKSLTGKCRFIEHLLLETCEYSGRKTALALVEFLTNCPNLTSLTLIRFGLIDEMAQSLVENSHKLTYLNMSRSMIKGRFLRDLELSCKESLLKTVILRSCHELQEKEMLEFCNSLLAGNVKSIKHIDVSSNLGLVSDRGKRCKNPKLPLERLKEERSDLTFVAEFPLTSSAKCYRVCDEVDMKLLEMMDETVEEDESDVSDEDFV